MDIFYIILIWCFIPCKLIEENKMDGIINLYKPGGITSHDAVSKIKKIFGTKRVGHAGTLDPMACGVLPVLVGRAACAQEYLMNHDKSYRAGMRFGITTDTGDITGNILSHNDSVPCEKDVVSCAMSFVGDICQIPPMYSAIKIDGKKLCDLAREGITVERKERRITIYSIDFVRRDSTCDFVFDVACSKGTYIRTLCEDIGQKLSCGGALFSLERLSCGDFKKRDSVTLEELYDAQQSGEDALKKFLISPEKVFSDKKVVTLSEFYSRLCKNGCEIYLKKLKISDDRFTDGELVRLYDNNSCFFAVGKVGDFREGKAIKAVCRFCD